MVNVLFLCLTSLTHIYIYLGAGLSAGGVAIDVTAVRVRVRGGNDHNFASHRIKLIQGRERNFSRGGNDKTFT